MHTVIVRTLTREYRIHTESREAAGMLAIVACEPEMEGFPLTPVDISVEGLAAPYRMALPDGEIVEGTALELAGQINALVILGTEDEEPKAPIIHGASILVGTSRILLVGQPRFGKTTLCLHLLASGIAVEGDEHVVVRDKDLVVRPRRLRVKSTSIPLVPTLAAGIIASPHMTIDIDWGPAPGKGSLYAVDPSIGGRPWRIAGGQAQHVVFMEPNHAGGSSLEPLGCDEAFNRLMDDCLLPSAGHGVAVSRLRRVAAEARTWLLKIGDLAEAELHIRNMPA